MTPKILSECGTEYMVDAKENYKVVIEAGEYLVIEAGSIVGKPASKFQHPNITLTENRLYNFRTYYRSGHKKWYSKAGVSHYFVVPRSAVTLLPEKGMSYVPALINGVKVQFNVSGGGNGNGWTDCLNIRTQISVNHKVADLKKIAEVAVRGTQYEGFAKAADSMEAGDIEIWNRLAAKANASLKVKVIAMLKAGKQPVIHMAESYQYDGKNSGRAVEVIRKFKKNWCDDTKTSYQMLANGGIKQVMI